MCIIHLFLPRVYTWLSFCHMQKILWLNVLRCLGRRAHLKGAVSFLMTSCVVSILCLLFATWNDVTSVKSYLFGSLLGIITNIGGKSVLVMCWARSGGLPESLPCVLFVTFRINPVYLAQYSVYSMGFLTCIFSHILT